MAHLNQDQLRRLARLGAVARLEQLREEEAAIRTEFPELFGGRRGNSDRAVTVAVSVNDRWLADVELPDPSAWVRSTLPLPRKATSRRLCRIDLRVSRTVGPLNHGVQLGAIALQRSNK